MALFAPGNSTKSPGHERLYALYELAFTAVDFTAALCFIVGSAMFYDENLLFWATTLFVIGSICFALKPTLRLARELHYLRLGEYEEIAKDG